MSLVSCHNSNLIEIPNTSKFIIYIWLSITMDDFHSSSLTPTPPLLKLIPVKFSCIHPSTLLSSNNLGADRGWGDGNLHHLQVNSDQHSQVTSREHQKVNISPHATGIQNLQNSSQPHLDENSSPYPEVDTISYPEVIATLYLTVNKNTNCNPDLISSPIGNDGAPLSSEKWWEQLQSGVLLLICTLLQVLYIMFVRVHRTVSLAILVCNSLLFRFDNSPLQSINEQYVANFITESCSPA